MVKNLYLYFIGVEILNQHIHATEITRTKKGYTALNREKENGRIENSSLLIFLASILWDRVDRFVVPSAQYQITALPWLTNKVFDLIEV